MSHNGRRNIFTAKQIERMNHSRWVEDVPCREIARVFGVNASTVRRYTQRLGTELHDDKPHKPVQPGGGAK